MASELEKKFFATEEVEKLMRNNSKVMEIIENHNNPEAAWSYLPKYTADAINAKRIEEDSATYTNVQQLINASNQHFWAYSTLEPDSHNNAWTREITEIVQLLWDTMIITPSEKNAKKFMRRSLDLAETAVNMEEFKDEQIVYILCNYIQGGFRTDRITYDSILKKFLDKMNKEKGLEETLDFFDKYLVDGQFLHPFPSPPIGDEPYRVKHDILREIHEPFKFSWNPNQKSPNFKDKTIRIDRTIANFNLHATWEMFLWINNLHSPFRSTLFNDRIKGAYQEVQRLTDLKGNAFVKFLEEHGFEEGVRDRYIWEYDYETGQTRKRYTQSSGDQFKSEFKNIVNEAKDKFTEALNVLGLGRLPEDKKVARSAYYRICKLWHPDLCNLPDAEEKTKKANLAWEMISKCYN